MPDEGVFPGGGGEFPGGPDNVDTDTGVGLQTGYHPEYTIAWALSTFRYLVGEIRPLKWEISRKDGTDVDEPSDGSITVVAPDGSSASTTPEMESGLAAPVQVAAADYTFTLKGKYRAEISLTIGTQVIEHSQPIYVRDPLP